MLAVNKLVVIGLGLIGGSLAAGLKANNACREVIGIARRQSTLNIALSNDIIDRGFLSLTDIAAELSVGDVIFIAVPTLSVEKILIDIKNTLPVDVTVTDGASVKGSVISALNNVYGTPPVNFVPGHPIAGSEKSGVTAADSQLYNNHRVILTPCETTGADHLARVSAMWQAVGADVLSMPVDEHDEVLAATSHLPHVIAYSLVDTLAHDAENENIFRYAAGGFRDFTRIASSDPVMWHDIMSANREQILNAIDLFQRNLSTLRDAIETKDSQHLLQVFTQAKAARDRFTKMLSQQSYISPMSNQLVQYTVQPGGVLTGHLRVPGDKSMSHRAVMLGSLATGVTEVSGFLQGEDALATIQAFRDMGVVIDGPDDGFVRVHGVGLHGLKQPAGPLYVGNAGTGMRLLAGIVAGQTFDVELTGDSSLSSRPMNRIAIPLREMGITIETAEGGRPPLKIQGSSKPNAIEYTLPMASAQVKSCVLLAGLYADGETSVIEPAPTRDHTERMLRGFGYTVHTENNRSSLKGGGELKGMAIDVPADISSAAFFMVGAAITPGSDITLEHVGINPTRVGVVNILQQMGADLILSNQREVGGEPVADIRVRYSPSLSGIDIPEDQVPLAIDEFPVLFVAAACAKGRTVLTGAEELRVKESDRIQAMADGLQAIGVNAQATDDGMIIEGGDILGGEVESHDDHRIAMAFTIAALRSKGAITVNNCANVATSFPGFVTLANQSGISIEEQVV